MLTRILAGGLIGGLAGGLIVTALLAVSTTPLIHYAEHFEAAQAANALPIVLVHAKAETAAAGFDIGRLLLTGLATVGAAIGYTWLLLGAMAAKGHAISARSVIPWAVAGFFATGLAPAFGLAPDLPGAAVAELGARQLWWIGTALATAAGMAAIAFGRHGLWIAAGVGLIALPHLIGAPHPATPVSKVPAEIAARFASMSLVVQALTWLIPASIAGFAIAWMARRAEAPGEASAA